MVRTSPGPDDGDDAAEAIESGRNASEFGALASLNKLLGGECPRVVQHRFGICERNPMFGQIGLSFGRIELDHLRLYAYIYVYGKPNYQGRYKSNIINVLEAEWRVAIAGAEPLLSRAGDPPASRH